METKKDKVITPKRDKVYVTKEGLKRLEEELEFLRNVKRPEVSERLSAAVQSFGELAENPEYEEAKREQAFVEGRILELEDLLSKAVVIDTGNLSRLQVGMGSKVKIEMKDLKRKTREIKDFMIVSSVEADPEKGMISNKSPIGEALLGKKPGNVVKVKIPKGEILIRILTIEK